jgi:hypothetical protein
MCFVGVFEVEGRPVTGVPAWDAIDEPERTWGF